MEVDYGKSRQEAKILEAFFKDQGAQEMSTPDLGKTQIYGGPVPMGTLLKTAAADPKTTNALLLVVVLCMSGLMPEQLNSLCGL
jgi:hypothetical protein